MCLGEKTDMHMVIYIYIYIFRVVSWRLQQRPIVRDDAVSASRSLSAARGKCGKAVLFAPTTHPDTTIRPLFSRAPCRLIELVLDMAAWSYV